MLLRECSKSTRRFRWTRIATRSRESTAFEIDDRRWAIRLRRSFRSLRFMRFGRLTEPMYEANAPANKTMISNGLMNVRRQSSDSDRRCALTVMTLLGQNVGLGTPGGRKLSVRYALSSRSRSKPGQPEKYGELAFSVIRTDPFGPTIIDACFSLTPATRNSESMTYVTPSPFLR